MDMQKIGSFLSQLRKEQSMTQEQLGEKLGVTNKTVSRWETGTYLPPVEMLQLLSELYGITINEILSGERLGEKEYREKAEENIKVTLSASAFTWKEKSAFFKKKWLREHLFGLVVEAVIWLALWGICVWLDQLLFVTLGNIGILWRIAYYRNQMMTYIEDHAFDGSGSQ
jgi:transcriptional regulator with XRE-family HTH domain